MTISTTTALSSPINPSTYGGTVSLTATITPGGSGPAMTGTATSFDGHLAVGSSSVTWNSGTGKGSATLSLATLPGGSRSLTAAYSGDDNYSPSTSAAPNQTVNKASANLSVSPGSSAYGQLTGLTATSGNPGAGVPPPGGNVTFLDGGSSVGVAPLLPRGGFVSSQATLNLSTLSVGSHPITASYAGDNNYASGTFGPAMQTVSKADTSTVLSSSANPSASGQSVTFTARVSAASPGAGTSRGEG
jgi:hypothetical protein